MAESIIVSMPTPPHTSEDITGQDRFNQDVVSLLTTLVDKVNLTLNEIEAIKVIQVDFENRLAALEAI